MAKNNKRRQKNENRRKKTIHHIRTHLEMRMKWTIIKFEKFEIGVCVVDARCWYLCSVVFLLTFGTEFEMKKTACLQMKQFKSYSIKYTRAYIRLVLPFNQFDYQAIHGRKILKHSIPVMICTTYTCTYVCDACEYTARFGPAKFERTQCTIAINVVFSLFFHLSFIMFKCVSILVRLFFYFLSLIDLFLVLQTVKTYDPNNNIKLMNVKWVNIPLVTAKESAWRVCACVRRQEERRAKNKHSTQIQKSMSVWLFLIFLYLDMPT